MTCFSDQSLSSIFDLIVLMKQLDMALDYTFGILTTLESRNDQLTSEGYGGVQASQMTW